jgi:hypothetical protein
MNSPLSSPAAELAVEALAWLRATYAEHLPYTERDIVWTVQRWIAREITGRGLPLRVFNDYGIEPGPRRSLSADIAILPNSSPEVLHVIEFKYEPSHRRPDIDSKKLPVVGWDAVVADTLRIARWVESGRTLGGRAVFIDEGGFAHARRGAYPGSEWVSWGAYGDPAIDVWVHEFPADAHG